MHRNVKGRICFYVHILGGLVLLGSGCGGISSAQLRERMQEVLRQAARSEDAQLCCHGLESLAEIGGPEAATLIRNRLTDPAPAVRFTAAAAAGDIQDQDARKMLENLLEDENDSVKLAAAYGLEKLGDRRFPNWYDQALRGEDVQLAGLSCVLLGKLGNTEFNPDSKDKLWQVLNQSATAPVVKLQAAEALARLGDEKILLTLLSYAASGYADDRLIAISGLEQLTGEDAYSMLVTLVDDPQLEVQLAAVRALGPRAQEQDVELARKGIRHVDKDGDATATARVRGLAARALGRVGKAQDGRFLFQAMADESVYVRVAAARAVIDYLRGRNEL